MSGVNEPGPYDGSLRDAIAAVEREREEDLLRSGPIPVGKDQEFDASASNVSIRGIEGGSALQWVFGLLCALLVVGVIVVLCLPQDITEPLRLWIVDLPFVP